MILIACLTCKTGIHISPDSDGAEGNLVGEGCEWWPDKYPCPVCDRKAMYVPAADQQARNELTMHELTPVEAYAAFNGMGLPEDQECGALAVAQQFAKKVKQVHCRNIPNTQRSVISWIEFDDGYKLYLAAGVQGAVVYRIRGPYSVMERISES